MRPDMSIHIRRGWAKVKKGFQHGRGLVIHGTSDAIVPIDPTGRQAAKMIPGAKFIEYDGAPHGFLATHAERATQDLLEFLA